MLLTFLTKEEIVPVENLTICFQKFLNIRRSPTVKYGIGDTTLGVTHTLHSCKDYDSKSAKK